MPRQPQTSQQIRVPRPSPRVDHLSSCRIGVLSRGPAGKKKMNQVRNQKQPDGPIGNPGLGVRIELEQRVKDQELDAGAFENLFPRYPLEYFADDVQRALVAITDGVFTQVPFGIDQTVIHTPTVDADASDRPSGLPRPFARRAKPRFDFSKDVRHVPTQMPFASGWRIVESTHFLQ